MVFGVVCFLSLPLSLVITSSYHLQGYQTVEKKHPPHKKEQENIKLRKWGKVLGLGKNPSGNR